MLRIALQVPRSRACIVDRTIQRLDERTSRHQLRRPWSTWVVSCNLISQRPVLMQGLLPLSS